MESVALKPLFPVHATLTATIILKSGSIKGKEALPSKAMRSTKLYPAVVAGDAEKVRKLLAEKNSYMALFTRGKEGFSLLHQAAIQGNATVCALLLDTLPMTTRTGLIFHTCKKNKTAFDYAASSGKIEVVRLFLDQGYHTHSHFEDFFLGVL